MSLRKNIGLSILNMGVQRVLDLVSLLAVTALVVRSLSREEYGMLSVVMSYGLVFNVFNVSVSAILVRDYQKIRERIGDYLQAFLLFALLKGAVVLLLSGGIGVLLYRRYHDASILAVLCINAITTILTYFAEPFSTLLSVDFRQSVLTRVSFASSLSNVALSAGAILFPSAVFVSAKNAAVTLLGLVLTVAYVRAKFQWGERVAWRSAMAIVKECLLGFSLWSHLIGITTDIIYRADLLILGWVRAPFQAVGNYNIALQLSNLSKLAPQILQYNATLGLSRSREARRQHEITFLFVKYSFLVSVATFAGYLLLGRFAIRVLAGTGVDEVFSLGLYIVAGLCLYNTFRPLISYGIASHDIREVFVYAILPSGLGTLACYVVMGLRAGAQGLAQANLVGGAIVTVFTLLYVHTRTDFRWRIALVTDLERDLWAKARGRLWPARSR